MTIGSGFLKIMPTTSFIHAFGAHLPERVVTNAELASQLGCTPEWMESVSGIRERRWAGEETVADLATARRARLFAKSRHRSIAS